VTLSLGILNVVLVMPLKRLLELREETKVLKTVIYYREIKISP